MSSVNKIINELQIYAFMIQKKKNQRPDANSSFSFTKDKTERQYDCCASLFRTKLKP